MHLPRRQRAVSDTSSASVTIGGQVPCASNRPKRIARSVKHEKPQFRPTKVATASGTHKVTALQKMKPVQAAGLTAKEYMQSLKESLKVNFGVTPDLDGWKCKLTEERHGKVRPAWFAPLSWRPLRSKREVAHSLGLIPPLTSLPRDALEYTQRKYATRSQETSSGQTEKAVAVSDSFAGTKDQTCAPPGTSAGITEAMGGLALAGHSQASMSNDSDTGRFNSCRAAGSTFQEGTTDLSDTGILQKARGLLNEHKGSRIVTVPGCMPELTQALAKSECEVFWYWELSCGAVITVQKQL